jgi:hypothetical protein
VTGRSFVKLAKSGDPAEHLFKQHLRVALAFLKQHLRVALAFLCALLKLPPKLACHVRKANQHVVTNGGEPFVHLLSERSDFDAYLLPKLSLDARKAGVHLVAHGGELCPHFAAYVREFNAHFGAELHNLRLYRAYSLTECRDLRGQCLESFHGLVQAFYAIRQQFIRHHSSVSARRSNSKRALDGRIKARWMPTTLPSSHRADNCVRIRTDDGRHIDAMSTFEVA